MGSANHSIQSSFPQAAVSIDFLHYGKLVMPGGRVPSSEGYAVTRRSSGISKEDNACLGLSSLLDVDRFEPDLIDASAERDGILAVRRVALSRGARAVIVRARFRPEDGEGTIGRLHQQAAIWTVSWEDWINYPLPLLLKAANLRATPDEVSVPRDKRIDISPTSLPLDAGVGGCALSSEALRIWDFVVPGGRAEAPRRAVVFGGDVFAGETQFLQAVGAALQNWPPGYEGKDQVTISCGLKGPVGTVSVGYVKSATTARGQFDESAARQRFTTCTRAARSTANGRPSSAGSARIGAEQPASRTASRPAPEVIVKFRQRYQSYRTWPAAETAIELIYAASLLGRWLDHDPDTADKRLTDMDEQELHAFRSLDVAARTALRNLPTGHLLDLAEVYVRLVEVGPTSPHCRRREEVLNEADCRLAELGVWLPEELDRFSNRLLQFLATGRSVETLRRSESLRSVMKRGPEGALLAVAAAAPEQLSKAFASLATRLQDFPAPVRQSTAPQDNSRALGGGIHGKYPLRLDAILFPKDYVLCIERALSFIARRVAESL
jgi:hypothetical protein